MRNSLSPIVLRSNFIILGGPHEARIRAASPQFSLRHRLAHEGRLQDRSQPRQPLRGERGRGVSAPEAVQQPAWVSILPQQTISPILAIQGSSSASVSPLHTRVHHPSPAASIQSIQTVSSQHKPQFKSPHTASGQANTCAEVAARGHHTSSGLLLQ